MSGIDTSVLCKLLFEEKKKKLEYLKSSGKPLLLQCALLERNVCEVRVLVSKLGLDNNICVRVSCRKNSD